MTWAASPLRLPVFVLPAIRVFSSSSLPSPSMCFVLSTHPHPHISRPPSGHVHYASNTSPLLTLLHRCLLCPDLCLPALLAKLNLAHAPSHVLRYLARIVLTKSPPLSSTAQHNENNPASPFRYMLCARDVCCLLFRAPIVSRESLPVGGGVYSNAQECLGSDMTAPLRGQPGRAWRACSAAPESGLEHVE